MTKLYAALVGAVLVGVIVVAQTLSDTVPNLQNPGVGNVAAYTLGWNGGTWARVKTFSLTNMPIYSTTASSTEHGRVVIEKGSRWAVGSTPAVSLQATASIAAEAGVRHVADTVCFSAGSTTAPALTKLNVNLRDGATGAGTIIGSWTVVVSAATGQNVAPQCFPNLQLVGTTNTAMTLEFSALLTNLFEDVTLTGFNTF